MANITVSDYAGATETVHVTVSVSLSDLAGAVENIVTPNTLPNINRPALVFMAAAYQGAT